MTKQPKQNNRQVIEKFNTLYIQTRKKYLVQFADRYITLNKDRSANVVSLNNGMIDKHLKGDLTYGIFNGGYFNKFITFDVDFAEHATARWATLKLIDVLVSEFNILRSDIHVSISGSKGFHVDLFFDNPIAVNDIRQFYNAVIAEVGDIPGGKIEFRPSWTQGVKLPLGIHQKTGRRCWFCDNLTLEPIENFKYILGIEPMDAGVITNNYFDLTDEQANEFEVIASETNINANISDVSTSLQKVRRILEAGQLIESHTRHATTFDLAKFFYSQGYEKAEALQNIMTVLHNTPRNYFHDDSTPDYWRKEADRLVDLVYDRGYTFGNADQPVTVHKSEILSVLSCGTFKTKQTLFSMLVTSKRYGPTFYFTESTAMQMIGTTSKKTVADAIRRLVDGGFIEYVRKGEIDKARSLDLGRPHYKPNKFRLLIGTPAEDEPSVNVNESQSIVDVANLLCDRKEIRRYVKRREYENQWKGA